MERIETGVKGLDDILEGGIPFPSVVLIAGEPGTGKTTLAMQSLFHGAKKGEKGLYITAISETVDQINKFMSGYAFYDQDLVDKGLVRFMDVGQILVTKGSKEALDFIVDQIRKEGATRVVIDPMAPFSYMLRDDDDYRRFLHEFFIMLKAMETLTYLLAEFSPEEVTNIENYMADGVIFLYLQPMDNPAVFKPGLQIRKMRGTEHSKGIFSLGFTKDGLRIL